METKTNSAEETRDLAGSFAVKLPVGSIVLLCGDLGAGKTTFTQGFAQALGFHDDVTSPTFTLVNVYAGKIPIYHIDLYRLNNLAEEDCFDLDQYIPSKDGITLIEWGERIEPSISNLPHWRIDIEWLSENRRRILATEAHLSASG